MAQNDYTALVEGSYSGIYDDVAKSVNSVVTVIRMVIGTLEKVADGDLSDLEFLRARGARCENDRLVPTSQKMMENIKALVEETAMLSAAAVEGKLSTRGDADKFKGGYATVIQGINETLDAVIEPIREASSVLMEVASGNLHVKMNGDYRGDHQRSRTH